jgi:hypothetical protein
MKLGIFVIPVKTGIHDFVIVHRAVLSAHTPENRGFGMDWKWEK